MATLIFDIETVGEAWSDVDTTTKEVLTRWIERTAKTAEEKESQIRDLSESLGFSPLTGSIVAIGVYDLERKQGAVYYSGEGSERDEQVGEYILKHRTEKEMLEDFWEGAKSYDTFVTYNGRGFDVPFLLHRSVVHEVMPTYDLMEGRYLYQQKGVRHVDLQDQLTFYGAMFRKPSLHLFCRAYGIESPKGEGVSGDDVATLFLNKQFRDIARYNARDVTATTELYEKWLTYLAPETFKNRYRYS
jgi:DNA polymerase elongation subunit (family B)